MAPIHTRLLSILSQLQTSPDLRHRGLAGWVEMADDITEEPPNIRITAGTRQTYYKVTSIEVILGQFGA